jgi:integrase
VAILLKTALDLKGAKDLLTAVNLYAILCFIAQTGARPEEACGLQVTDIKRFHRPPPDRPNVWAEVTIQHTNTKYDGFRQRTKNDEERVVLPLGRLVVDALDRVERYWQCRGQAMRDGPCKMSMTNRRIRNYFETWNAPLETRQHGFIFVHKMGKPYHSHCLSPRIARLARRAGVVKRDGEGRILIGKDGKTIPKITAYSLRKMVATHNAQRLPTHIGAAVTGHSEEVYLRDYVSLSAEDQLRVANSLSELEADLAVTATVPQQRLLTG